jgi:hypothetical protein
MQWQEKMRSGSFFKSNFLFLLALLILPIFSAVAEIDKLDIENHPQSSFPAIRVEIDGKSAFYYGSDSSNTAIKLVRSNSELKGEIPLSGYIFAKEFVDSFRISGAKGNKKTKEEFLKIFDEKNPGKLVAFILATNERRPSEESGETQFPSGYIELKSPRNNNERYFIKLSEVKNANMTLNADRTKINLLKSVTVYGFQNILSGLNFGDIEKGSDQDKLYSRLEKINLSVCSFDCPLDATKNLSGLALNVGKVVSFEVVGNDKIENMDDFNKYVLAQQWCLLNNFSTACHVPALDVELNSLTKNPVLAELLKKHQSFEKLCKFIQE